MGSDLPYMAAVVTKHVLLDERDANGMRPSIVMDSILPVCLALMGDDGSCIPRNGW
ncbi:hypothetical protein PTKU46_97970 [Paraburkholderia terrae]